MFTFRKETKAKVAGYDQNIEMVARAINGYFQTNEKPNKDFEIETIGDKMVNFIASVDERIKTLETELEAKGNEINEKDAFIGELKDIISDREREIKELADEKSALQIQLTAKNRESERAKTATAKGGKK